MSGGVTGCYPTVLAPTLTAEVPYLPAANRWDRHAGVLSSDGAKRSAEIRSVLRQQFRTGTQFPTVNTAIIASGRPVKSGIGHRSFAFYIK
ncbi:hypothetical protein [Paenibacillus sp. FSL W8-0194]|uniref:hypothetical protein n=1 Tax=Paenibacillus sp. FSL W8-0194 TaxID=2921711 RepID=UPI0030DAA698